MDMSALVASIKAKRESTGLKSTYVGADGAAFDMFHPNEAVKAFNDFKYALFDKYGRNAGNVPAFEMAELSRLDALARTSKVAK